MFFPIMKSLDLEGFVSIVYEPCNNWETRFTNKVFIYLIWSDGAEWNTLELHELSPSERLEISTASLPDFVMSSSLAVVYASKVRLPEKLLKLPSEETWVSKYPAWRNTSGFRLDNSQTSYQSEVIPLPEKGTLLTFHPFIQYGGVDNYLLILNLLRAPQINTCRLQVIDSKDKRIIDEVEIRSNSTTTIALNEYGFKQSDLPIFYSPDLAAIPFGLGRSRDGLMLSLEHTHPPASLVLFGARHEVQGRIKRNWVKGFW
jgi:hypothetical protein